MSCTCGLWLRPLNAHHHSENMNTLQAIYLNLDGVPQKFSGSKLFDIRPYLFDTSLHQPNPPRFAAGFCRRRSGENLQLIRSHWEMASIRLARQAFSKNGPSQLSCICRLYSTATEQTYQNLLISTPKPGVALSMALSVCSRQLKATSNT